MTARLPNVYGGGDFNEARVIPSVIKDLLHNKRPTINMSDNIARPYVFIEDIVQALLLLAEHHAVSKIVDTDYGFSNITRVTTVDLVNEIIGISGKKHLSPIVREHCNLEAIEGVQDQITYVNSLGWRPETSIQEGLFRTIEWYKRYYST